MKDYFSCFINESFLSAKWLLDISIELHGGVATNLTLEVKVESP